jgi:hypothetical protein
MPSSATKAAQTAQAAQSPGERFGAEIERAKGGGASPDSLLLQLTLRDGSRLRRDRAVGPDDISFSPEGMRFLGVKVVEGQTSESQLVVLQD